MKLILTLPEVAALVRKALALPNETPLHIEVVNDTHELALALRTALHEFPNFRSSQKIAAIKRFRELGPKKFSADWNRDMPSVMLADAKFAVENPDTAFANIARSGVIQ